MRSEQRPLSDTKAPYIKIQFNIESQNVTNNNMISPPSYLKASQNDMPMSKGPAGPACNPFFESSPKRHGPFEKEKSGFYQEHEDEVQGNYNQETQLRAVKKIQEGGNKKVKRKTNSKSRKMEINSKRRLNKSTKSSGADSSCSHSQASRHIFKSKRASKSEFFASRDPSQKGIPNNYTEKLKVKLPREVPRKQLLELMLEDFKKGRITSDNLKRVILSIIEQEVDFKKQDNLDTKGNKESKNGKARTHSNGRTSSSLRDTPKHRPVSSLRGTPRHRPAKSQSERLSLSSMFLAKKEKKEPSPELICRSIKKQQFVDKILIKGVNSSLFLSRSQGCFETNPIDSEEQYFNIVTSDSVRDIQKEMFSLRQLNQQQERLSSQGQQQIDHSEKFDSNRVGEMILAVEKIQKRCQIRQTFEKFKSFCLAHCDQQPSPKIDHRSQHHYSSLIAKNEDQFSNNSQQPFQMNDDLDSSDKLNEKSMVFQEQQQSQKHSIRNEIQHLSDTQAALDLVGYVSSELSNPTPTRDQNRVQSIKNREFEKWQQVMEYIKYSIESEQQKGSNNQEESQSGLSAKECLENILEYFESETQNVQDQLAIYKRKVEVVGGKGERPGWDLLSKTRERHQIGSIGFDGDQLTSRVGVQAIQARVLKKTTPSKVVELIHYGVGQKKQSSHQKKQRLISEGSEVSLSSISSVRSSEGLRNLSLDNLTLGLKKRSKTISEKKEQEICRITERFINDKISAAVYQEEKCKVEKWFRIEMHSLKQTLKSLTVGYDLAKNVIGGSDANEATIFKDRKGKGPKDRKMLRCISQKYLGKPNKSQKKKKIKNYSKLQSEKEDSQESEALQGIGEFETEEVKKVEHFDHQIINENVSRIGRSWGQWGKQNQKFLTEYGQSKGSQRHNSPFECNGADLVESNMVTSEIYDQWDQECSRGSDQDAEQNGPSGVLGFKAADEEGGMGHIIVNRRVAPEEQLKSPQPILEENYEVSSELVQIDGRVQTRREQFSPELSRVKKLSNYEVSEQFQRYDDQGHGKAGCSENSPLGSLQIIDNTVNDYLKRLRHLSEDEKEDIFEFMFLDLCLQLFLEQSKESPIMKSVEKYILWMRKRKNLAKGFKTSLPQCRAYLENISEFIKADHSAILSRLEQPIGPSAKQMLRFMRDYDCDVESNQSQEYVVTLILPMEVFEAYQREPVNHLVLNRYYDNEEREKSRLEFLYGLHRIHCKAMFDSLNESLDRERVFGIWGKPFPWKKPFCCDKKLSLKGQQRCLERAVEQVVENCSYICGILIEKEDNVFGGRKVSEDYVNHLREDRISRMLSNEMIVSEQKWTFYDDEETEVLIELTQEIENWLFAEAISQLSCF